MTTRTPYAETSGWSGSNTSEERARRNDRNGTTTVLQQTAINFLLEAAFDGLTWKELADKMHIHHGSASGVLSVLHKAGDIERLTETRDRCKVYIHPEYTFGRDTEEHASNKYVACPHCGGVF